MISWLRLWHEMPIDPKWKTISKKSGRPICEIVAVFSMMLVNASQSSERGMLENWSDEDVAAAMDMEEKSVTAIREAMQGKALNGFRLTGWEKRQPKREDETATQRSKRYRENATQCNATQRNATQISTDKDKDKDADTDIDKDTPPQGGAKPRTNLLDKELTYFLNGARILGETLTDLDFIQDFRLALRNVEDDKSGRGKFLIACENLARAPDDDRRCVKSVTWLLEDKRKSLARVITWAAKNNGAAKVEYDRAPADWSPTR